MLKISVKIVKDNLKIVMIMINEKQIREWLGEEGLFRERVKDDDSNFHFIVEYPEGNSIDLIQPRGKEDILIIGCATNISPEHVAFLKKSKPEEKQKLIWDFKFTINQMLLDFQIDHPNNEIKTFIISDELYEDRLTKHKLIFKIKKIFKCKLQCMLLVEKMLSDF